MTLDDYQCSGMVTMVFTDVIFLSILYSLYLTGDHRYYIPLIGEGKSVTLGEGHRCKLTIQLYRHHYDCVLSMNTNVIVESTIGDHRYSCEPMGITFRGLQCSRIQPLIINVVDMLASVHQL